MEPSNQSDDRWKELADLLGLTPNQREGAPPEARPTASAPLNHPAPPAKPAPEPVRYEEPAQEIHEIEEIIEDDDTVVDALEMPQAVADEDGGYEEGDGTGQGDADEDAAEAPPGPGEEDKPKRGRRRRRRGRRRGGEKVEGETDRPSEERESRPAQPNARAPEQRETRPAQPRQREERAARPTQPSAPRDRDANNNDRRDSRSRHGGRRDERQEVRPPVVEEREDSSEELEDVEMSNGPATSARNLDDDTDFSDWSVPSWQELISSLYRPDR